VRKKKLLPLLHNVEVTGIAAEGKAIARHGDMVIFVPFGAPGDIVDIQVTRKRRNYMEGRIVKIHGHSSMRIEPVCQHFGVCGGCKWQHLSYRHQLSFKQQQVIDHFKRIGKLDFPPPEEIVPSPETEFYRNKLEYTFTNRRWLTGEEVDSGKDIEDFRGTGFHITGRFDKVLDIKKCWLQADPSNSLRDSIRDYAVREDLEFFDLVKQEGFLRTLIIRTSSAGEVMVIIVFFRDSQPERQGLMEFIAGEFPGLTSLMYVVNPKANDTIHDLEVKLFSGRDHIVEEMDGLKFRIGPKSFYQTNPAQARKLYGIVMDYASPRPQEVIYDLYTGTGTIAAFLARHCHRVVGLEYVPESVNDALYNARLNNLDNLSFFAGDIREMLTPEFIGLNGSPHTLVTDPPRTGMHQAVVDRIIEIAPSRIVYVSCNSATQARDIQLMDRAYRISRMRPVDMFPHTHHVENVVLLEKR
jgi:23S rRNA (uracil1939-C5)-methyltransferase